MSPVEQGAIVEVRAALFAADWHRGQKHGDRPYTTHLLEAREVFHDFGIGSGAPGAALCVAVLLHDVLEDTDCTLQLVTTHFGGRVAELVWAVSGMPKGAPRKARVADAYVKIRCCHAAALVKLADRIANVESCVKQGRDDLFSMYRKEQPAFEELLTETNVIALYPDMVKRLRAAFAKGCE